MLGFDDPVEFVSEGHAVFDLPGNAGRVMLLLAPRVVQVLLGARSDPEFMRYDAGARRIDHAHAEPLDLGLLGLVQFVPVAGLSLVSGSVADRFDYDLLVMVANWPAPRRTAWRTLLRARAIENLVENALVHGLSRRLDSSLLEVAARREGGTLRIAVRDDGPGIAAEDRARALRTFERLDSARGRPGFVRPATLTEN